MQEFKRVAVIIETSSAFGRRLLRGVSRFSQEAKAWSAFFEPYHLSEILPTWLQDWEGDGILARITNAKNAKTLIATGLPLIDLRGGGFLLGLPFLGIDHRRVAEKAYLHLRECGIEHFAYVGAPSGYYYYDDELRKGFCECVELDGRACHVFNRKIIRSISGWESYLNALIKWLESLPKPVGLMCGHDWHGKQVLDSCQNANIGVPDEIAVLGVDDDEVLCGFTVPPLSSVAIDSDRIGYEAARLLDSMMQHREQTHAQMVFDPGEVVVRESTDVVACNDPEVVAAIRFIRQHVCHRVTVDDVLEHVHISRATLYKRFERIVGRSLKQEIVFQQMKHAKMLLSTTDWPIYEVANQLGFEEANYFITAFRKHVGITPMKYRFAGSK